MRLASIHWDGQDRIAAAAGEDALIDLNLALEATGGRRLPAFRTMLDLVRRGPAALTSPRPGAPSTGWGTIRAAFRRFPPMR